MATVYKAYEPGLDRHVALKVLPQEFLHDEGFAERFRREAKFIARLEHPNIVPIHGFGIEEKTRTPWMAMRLVTGGALASAMRGARMAPERVVAVLRGVAEALDYAHGKGVIHRDIKPQNILLDEAGRVYLADFGIAKMVEGSPGLTQTGMISGTPQYMAPEQAMATTVDSRADVYALGVVAYEMLTGRVPFAADTPVAVLMKHVQDPIPVPSPHDVPEPLTRVLVKALAKRPEDRWPTAGAFVQELSAALAQAPREGRPASATMILPTTAGGMPHAAAAGPARGGTPATGTATPPAWGPSTSPTAARVPPPPTYAGAAATAPPGPGPGGGMGRGLVLALVGAVVVMGVLATGVLLVVLRPGPPGKPERPPVTVRSSAATDEGMPPPVEVADPAPGLASPEVMATPPVSGPSPSPRATPPPARLARATPATEPDPPPVTAPPAADPPTPAPAVAAPAPVSASFRGAGRVETGDRFFEKTMAFAADEPLPFEASVGPVKVRTVQFSLGDRRRFGEVDDLRSELRAVLPVECRGAGSWQYKVQVELLDEDGRRLDRFDEDGRCRDEVKNVSASRGILKALASAVRGVRIRFEASRR